METNVIKFCDVHKFDLIVSSCVTCSLVSWSVGRSILPELIRLMKEKVVTGSDIPSAAERYATRLDEKAPTLTFSESDLSLAVSLFGQGKMAQPSLFKEPTREYLYLPSGPNDLLTKSVQLEKMFLKFKRDKNFSNIFS